MPRVSIGLPVYNGENFVADAIESVIAQSYTDWELVISDNASTDRTLNICQAYADRDARIRLHSAQKNQGAAWNFNHVFAMSSGSLFRWLSHDDFLAPSCIAKCVEALDLDGDAVLCSTATGVIDTSGRQVLDDAPGQSDFVLQELTASDEAKRLENSSHSDASTRYCGILFHSRRCYEVYGLIRREVMDNTQLHPNYCGGEKVWLAEVALMGRIIELPEKLFYCRWHDARFTANNSALEQAEHMAPGKKRRFALPHQYRSTIGYLQLILAKQLTLKCRMRCLMIWIRFTLQPGKWLTIVSQTLSGTATNVSITRPTRLGDQIVPPRNAGDANKFGH